ncbi:hypothetical protein DSO57_1034875 [Entomophthora muscae]|uniref:Uncharacterized protein n=1 Tax=Entomophthora muscae TaxID=34485 RepID=A0ACC2REJ0_9FUNG|nr:hypothetical protein DSO57_1034875 [Entomophthora muscae]
MGLLLILAVLSPILASHRPFKSDEMPKTNGWESLRHAANYKDTLAALGISFKYISNAVLKKHRNIPNPTFSQHDFAGKDFQNYTLHEESHSVAPLESAYNATLPSEKAMSSSLPKSLASSFTQTETPSSKYTPTTESSTSRNGTESSYSAANASRPAIGSSKPASESYYSSRAATASQTNPSIGEPRSAPRSATDPPSRAESEPYPSSRLVSGPASQNGTEPASDPPSKYASRPLTGPASRNGSEPSADPGPSSRPGSELHSASKSGTSTPRSTHGTAQSAPNTESSTPSTTSTARSNATPGSAPDSGSDPKYDAPSTPHTQPGSQNSLSTTRPHDYAVDIGSVDMHHLKSTELSHPALRTLTNQSYTRESILLATDTIMSVAPAQPYTKAKYGTIDRDGNQISYKSPTNTRRVSALASDASARRPRRPLSTLEPKVSPQQPDKDQVRRPFSTYNALQ